MRVNRYTFDEAASIVAESTSHVVDEGPMRVHTLTHPVHGEMVLVEGHNGDFIAVQRGA